MTKLTDEQVAAIRDGCEGVTPGPWYAEAQTGPVTDEGQRRPRLGVGAQSRFDTNAAKDDDQDPMDDAWLLGIWGVLTAEDYDNAAHIARCDPDTIRALATEVLEARALADHAERRHWHDGEPPKPQRDEWFIAETIYGDRVCLKALPEEFTYDYKTADETYIAARNIKRWMRFPDSHFIEPAPNAALKAAAPPIRTGAAETDAAREVLESREALAAKDREIERLACPPTAALMGRQEQTDER
jgi:hypothetical protein